MTSKSYSRERTEGPFPETMTMVWSFSNGGGYSNSRPSGDFTKQMTDIVTPGFHQKVRDGEVINNPCNLKVEEWYCEGQENSRLRYSHVSDNYANKTIKEEGNLSAWLIVDLNYQPYQYSVNQAPQPSFDVDGQAKSFCLANVDSTPYEFAEDIGELRETLTLLRNPLTAIRDLAKVYKRRRKAIRDNPKFKEKPQAEAKALADLWNQYRFAFAPLIRSIMNACEAWDNRDRLKRPSRRSAHGYSHNSESAQSGVRKLAPLAADAYWSFSDIRKVDAHATIYYEVSNPLANWQFALGLRLKDIPKTMWQLFPLSFMVDRLYNLSNAIAGLSNLILSSYTVSILAASLTKRWDATRTVSLTALTWSTSEYIFELYGTPDSMVFHEFEYDRQEWTPEVWDSFPPFTGGGLTDSVTKTIDLVALTLSRLL